jgi:two-component sensor histidine kinase
VATPVLRVLQARQLRGPRAAGAESTPHIPLGLRFAAVQIGCWLGWASICVVVAGLALDMGARHRLLLVCATLAAAAGNAVAMVIPWREWLATRRGRHLLDLWCGGVIAFVALLVVDAGSTFSLLLFLAVPFVAVVQIGWRRGFWLTVSAGTCSTIAVLVSLPLAATAMRLALVAATVTVALLLTRTISREAARADLERTFAREANHRIKNDLQMAADLLLLGRPENGDGAAFDETAARIRSIAAVHRLLTEAGDRIEGGALLRSIAGPSTQVRVEADPLALDAATAQKVGLVANELVTNALRHGSPPIVVRLTAGPEARLRVEDAGGHGEPNGGFGLELVRRTVEHGLHGRFELTRGPGGGTSAEVLFPAPSR